MDLNPVIKKINFKLVLFHLKFFLFYFISSYFTSINSLSIDLVNRLPLPSTTIHRHCPPLSAVDYCRLLPITATVCCHQLRHLSPSVAIGSHLPLLAAATIPRHPRPIVTICHCQLTPATTFCHHPLPLYIITDCHHLPQSAAAIHPCRHHRPLPPATVIRTVGHHRLQD